MDDTLRVRLYNVHFGDAVLVTIPDFDPATCTTETRHLLIDVGNVLHGEGGRDDLFQPVVDNILAELAGRPLDLYVMTHEHLDHVQGLFHVATQPHSDLKARLRTTCAWLTASAEPGYYERHPEANKKKLELAKCFQSIERYLNAAQDGTRDKLAGLLVNNNPRRTEECVDYLRQLAETTHYLHRGADLAGRHPFKEARFCVWAPEEDTSDYYGVLQPMALHLEPADAGGFSPAAGREQPVMPMPPPGVDAGAFYNLVNRRQNGFIENLLAIDQAANNSSLVFCLEWRGWRLLFPGDAEVKSWEVMRRRGVLQPVHFLKVAHHGSHNGTPTGAAFDAILPPVSPDGRERKAAVSTWPGTYSGVPQALTIERLRSRATLVSTLDQPDQPWIDVFFKNPEPSRDCTLPGPLVAGDPHLLDLEVSKEHDDEPKYVSNPGSGGYR